MDNGERIVRDELKSCLSARSELINLGELDMYKMFDDRILMLIRLIRKCQKKISKSHCTYEHPPFNPEKCEEYRKNGCDGCIHNKGCQ